MKIVRNHRKWTTGFAVLVTASMLAACAPELPALSVDEALVEAPMPVLTEDRVIDIANLIGETVDAADKDKDGEALSARVTGPAAGIRKAEYRLAKAQEKPEAITELPTELQSVFMTASQTWPRNIFAVTERPENLEAERFVVVSQEDARADYKLWAWFSLFPGVTVPTFPAAETGTTDLTVLDESLQISPQEALEQYADLLKLDGESKFKDVFDTEVDGFVKEIAERRKQLTEAGTQVKGSYEESFSVGKDLRTLKTMNGGAVVVGTITTSGTLTGEKGAIITPSEVEKAFLDKDAKPKNALTVKRTAVVGIYIPAKDSEEKAAAIGRTIRTTGAEIPEE